MSNYIVTVIVSQTLAPTPNTLQQTGAFISQGGTTLAAGTYQLLTAVGSLASILTAAQAITTMTWSGSVVTVTTAAPHGYPNGATFQVVIAGAVPTGYNGSYAATVTTTTQFTYPLVTNPGTMTTAGTVVAESQVELVAMNTTFWANGSTAAVYVLELGVNTVASGLTSLTTFINSNPLFFYSYLVPRTWTGASGLPAFLLNYNSTTAKTYFFLTVTLANYSSFSNLNKCVLALIEAPAVAAAAVAGTAVEFSIASVFFVTLNYAPSPINLVTPLSFSFLTGVTPYPTVGNSTLFASLKAANINWVTTGAEGGISNTILKWGTTLDGNDFIYWYSVDWCQINLDLNLANEIINGSNNPLNPLYYNQNGINRLQARAQAVMTQAIQYGLALSPVIVTAIPFATYVAANPGNYPLGIYNGLSVTYTPTTGFISITFALNVSQFPI